MTSGSIEMVFSANIHKIIKKTDNSELFTSSKTPF